MAEDDVAGSLIDALATEGEHVDDGGFTLDATAAYEKLREYQLVNPIGYLTLLVEAAWIASDGRGSILISPGTTTTVVFEGVSLAPGSLGELYSAVLGGLSKLEGEALRRARVLQLLGLAANSALGLEPEELLIEASGADGATQRVRIGKDGGLTLERGKPLQPATIRFHLRGRVLGFGRVSAERELIIGRCRHTRLAVFLHVEQVSRGLQVDFGEPTLVAGKMTRTAVRLGDRIIGFAGHLPNPNALGFTWIVNRGVAIRDPESEGLRGVEVVVEVDLPVDLSRGQLLRGPELDAVRGAIMAARETLPAPVRPRLEPREPSLITKRTTMTGWLAIACFVSIGVFLALLNDGDRTVVPIELTRPEGLELAQRCRDGALNLCAPAAEHLNAPNTRMELFARGCAGSEQVACEDLVATARELTRFAVDREPLRQALVRACAGISGRWCLEAAWYEHHGFVDPDAPADTRVDEDHLLARACAAGVARACELRGGPTLATRCEGGDALACYARGLSGFDRRNHTLSVASLAALDRACELELAEGCHASGVARLRGLAQPPDLAGAERDFEEACTLAGQERCAAALATAEIRATGRNPRATDPQFPHPNPPKHAEPWR